MPITSINAPRKLNFAKVFNYLITIIITGLIVYFGKDLFQNVLALQGKSMLTVTSANQEAEVYLNGSLLGRTPIENKSVRAGESKITLKTEARTYEATVNLQPKTHGVINRDLGVSESFSSGQNFWIEKSPAGTVLSVTSEPSGATIYIDNSQVGKTPFSSNNLTAGEYDVRVSMPGFEDQMSRIKIQSGYNLNIAFKMYPVPVPSNISAFEGSPNLYDLSVSNNLVTSDTQNWAKTVVYWNTSRGINLASLGLNKEPVFDYLIDYKGNIYDGDGVLLPNLDSLKEPEKGAYLGRSSDGAGLSDQAKEALTKVSGLSTGRNAVVKETGTGWLRVRDAANLNGIEVARVDVGKSYQVLEEQTEWVKIKVSESLEGWVSKSFVNIN